MTTKSKKEINALKLKYPLIIANDDEDHRADAMVHLAALSSRDDAEEKTLYRSACGQFLRNWKVGNGRSAYRVVNHDRRVTCKTCLRMMEISLGHKETRLALVTNKDNCENSTTITSRIFSNFSDLHYYLQSKYTLEQTLAYLKSGELSVYRLLPVKIKPKVEVRTTVVGIEEA